MTASPLPWLLFLSAFVLGCVGIWLNHWWTLGSAVSCAAAGVWWLTQEPDPNAL